MLSKKNYRVCEKITRGLNLGDMSLQKKKNFDSNVSKINDYQKNLLISKKLNKSMTIRKKVTKRYLHIELPDFIYVELNFLQDVNIPQGNTN